MDLLIRMEPIEILTYLLIFFLGASMGSFYNVIIDRMPNDMSVVHGRSECTECHTQLKWYDLIPIFSFIFLKGKCRYCHKKLSIQYLLSELSMGFIFLFAFLIWGRSLEYSKMFIVLTLWSMLFVVGIMDYKYKIIIDQVLVGFTLCGIVLMLVSGYSLKNIVLGCLSAFLLYGFIYLATKYVLKKEGFGFGDVLFLSAIGCYFDAPRIILIGILSFYVCLVFILLFFIKNRKLHKEIEIPFAPSICLTAFIFSLYGDQIVYFFMKLLGFY